MVRLAGADAFLRAAAGWLDVGVHQISNVNSVGRVYQLIRGRYRASRHHSQDLHGLCAWCGQWIQKEVVVPCRPSNEHKLSLCCGLPVHLDCDSEPKVSHAAQGTYMCNLWSTNREWGQLCSRILDCTTEPHTLL
jgi:hypothetical protein